MRMLHHRLAFRQGFLLALAREGGDLNSIAESRNEKNWGIGSSLLRR
jgi:hypothetical protein